MKYDNMTHNQRISFILKGLNQKSINTHANKHILTIIN